MNKKLFKRWKKIRKKLDRLKAEEEILLEDIRDELARHRQKELKVEDSDLSVLFRRNLYLYIPAEVKRQAKKKFKPHVFKKNFTTSYSPKKKLDPNVADKLLKWGAELKEGKIRVNILKNS